MAIVADMEFGVDEVTVGDVTQMLDVCGLADDLFSAVKSVPDGLNQLEEITVHGKAVNAVLVSYGFPPIPVPVAAWKFAERILRTAIDLKKKACGIQDSDDGLESPNDFQVSE